MANDFYNINIEEKKPPRNFKGILKTIIIWVLIILVCREIFTNTKEDAIINAPYYKEPEQIFLNSPYKESLKIVIKKDNLEVVVKPQATYKISARVVAKSRILGDDIKELVPYDIGLVWGDLMKDRTYKKLGIHQYQRWLTYRISSNNPSLYNNIDYIQKHISNNHFIPANPNILKGIKKIKKYDKIYAEGYLVYCDISYKKNPFFSYNSSLSREDTGDHACEIFYVTKLISPRGTWEWIKRLLNICIYQF